MYLHELPVPWVEEFAWESCALRTSVSWHITLLSSKAKDGAFISQIYKSCFFSLVMSNLKTVSKNKNAAPLWSYYWITEQSLGGGVIIAFAFTRGHTLSNHYFSESQIWSTEHSHYCQDQPHSMNGHWHISKHWLLYTLQVGCNQQKKATVLPKTPIQGAWSIPQEILQLKCRQQTQLPHFLTLQFSLLPFDHRDFRHSLRFILCLKPIFIMTTRDILIFAVSPCQI